MKDAGAIRKPVRFYYDGATRGCPVREGCYMISVGPRARAAYWVTGVMKSLRVAHWVNGCDFLEVPVAERPFDVEETGWWELIGASTAEADAFGQPTYWLDA